MNNLLQKKQKQILLLYIQIMKVLTWTGYYTWEEVCGISADIHEYVHPAGGRGDPGTAHRQHYLLPRAKIEHYP